MEFLEPRQHVGKGLHRIRIPFNPGDIAVKVAGVARIQPPSGCIREHFIKILKFIVELGHPWYGIRSFLAQSAYRIPIFGLCGQVIGLAWRQAIDGHDIFLGFHGLGIMAAFCANLYQIAIRIGRFLNRNLQVVPVHAHLRNRNRAKLYCIIGEFRAEILPHGAVHIDPQLNAWGHLEDFHAVVQFQDALCRTVQLHIDIARVLPGGI